MIAWRTKPWKRRLITRCIGIIPSLAVAVAVGRQGIDALLVGSQVALSIVLTFVMIPCVSRVLLSLRGGKLTLYRSPAPTASSSLRRSSR